MVPGTEVVVLATPAPVDIREAVGTMVVLSIYRHHSTDQVVVHRAAYSKIIIVFHSLRDCLCTNTTMITLRIHQNTTNYSYFVDVSVPIRDPNVNKLII